jgi:hypothetical protein
MEGAYLISASQNVMLVELNIFFFFSYFLKILDCSGQTFTLPSVCNLERTDFPALHSLLASTFHTQACVW